ncbi:MAG TPA: PAS domain S-box protein, partial [Geobacteraceae bacterium]|nr:PAS domain S-box protein [Geobacteraceae bacterium]
IKYYVLALAISLALFLTFLIWSGMLKRRVEQRTAELRRSEEELRQAHDYLENRVEERTAELQHAKELLEEEITERKRTEDALLLSQFCIDRAAIGIFQVSLDTGQILRFNDAACRSIGCSAAELGAMTIFDVDPSLTRQRYDELQGMVDESGSSTFETVHRRKNGTTYPVEVTTNNLEFQDKKYGFAFFKDISERREAEEALLLSQFCIDKAGIGIYQSDGTGTIFNVNEHACKSLGYSMEELCALTVFDIDPEITPERMLELKEILDERGSVTHQTTHRRRDGTTFPVEITANILDFRGRKYGISFVKDITERRQAEEVLRESESRVRRKLESILDPEGDIGELDLADIIDAPQIQALMDDLYRNTGLKMSIIDLKGRVLVDVGWQDICLKFHRIHPETRERCHESDTDLTVGVPPGEFRTYRCRNNMWHLVTTIFVGGRHMGNLFMGQFFFENEELDYDLFRAQARQYGFPEEEYIAALEAVPRQSEECVDKGKAFFLRLIDMFSRLSYGNIKLAHSLAERDRLTATLRESEARLKLAMDLAKLGAWEYDVSTGLFSFDDQFYALYGTTAEQEGGTLMSAEVYARKFIPPEESAVVANGIEEVRVNSHFQVEHRIIRADGEERFIVVRGEAVFNHEGRFVKIRGANQDVTERKLAEEAIRDSRAKYQAIVDNFEGLIYICSQDYRVEFMNRKLIERTGYNATGKFCYKMMHDRDSVCPWCVNERVFAGETLHWEMFSPKDNHWYYVVNVPIPHADCTISKQSMMLDITDRMQAEEDLRKANMVVENSPVVLFRCKATPGWPVELVSNNVIQFGYTPEEFLSGELTYSSIVYPRDLAKLIAETEEYSATGKGKWLQEYRIVTKEGDLRWISDETVCERNEEGEITYYEGVIIDVT